MSVEELTKKLDEVNLKDIGQRFSDPEENVVLIRSVFQKKIAILDNAAKLHRVLLKVSGEGSKEEKEALSQGIIEDTNFSILRTIWQAIGTTEKDTLIVSFVLKSITKSNKRHFDQFLLRVISELRTISEGLSEKDAFNVTAHLYLTLFYFLFSKYGDKLAFLVFEEVVPILLSFGHLTDDYEGDDSSSAYLKMLILQLLSLDLQLGKHGASKTPINDLIYEHFETFILLHEEDELTAKKAYRQLLSFLKNYEMVIQMFPEEFSATLFQSELFLTFLNRKINQLVKAYTSSSFGELLIMGFLKVFDRISINESCSLVIVKNYLYLILEISRIPLSQSSYPLVALSSLIVVKVWNTLQQEKLAESQKHEKIKQISPTEVEDFSLNEIYENLSDCLTEFQGSELAENYSVEGLAFLSLKVEFKKQIRGNSTMIMKLSLIIQTQSKAFKLAESSEPHVSNELVYGALLIFANILTFNAKLSKEEESIEYLKHYSTSNTILNNDQRIKNRKIGVQEKDSDEDISSFILSTFTKIDVISPFSKIFRVLTDNIKSLIVRIIYNVSLQKQFRTKLVQSGSINILLEYLMDDETRKTEKYENYLRLYALRALAKILISNNPSLVFNKYSVLVAIPFLCELLDDESEFVVSNKHPIKSFISKLVKPLDVLEALLSLTNLASLPDIKVKEKIFEKAWPYVENLILSENVLIQRSALELVSNLIFCPECTAMFFNPEDVKLKTRLEILVKLMNSSNIDVQISAVTIIVNASEYELIAEGLVSNSELFEKIVTILNSIDDYNNEELEKVTGLLLRLGCLLLNIVESTDQTTRESLKELQFKGNTLKSGIDQSLKVMIDEEVLAVFVEVCKVMKFI